MARIERFEDIAAWQKARELTACIYGVTRQGEFARDFGLRDQVRRASVSIMSNIAEGFERSSDRELGHFLSIAKGSSGEVRSDLYIALDARFISEPVFTDLRCRAEEVSRMLGGFMGYLHA
jgi:four helix bundle protein